MNTYSEKMVWRAVGIQSEVEGAGRQVCAVEELFPDDERILERFNRTPETEELCQELIYALREVGRFLSGLLMAPTASEPGLSSE
jgi:hypothetical protein